MSRKITPRLVSLLIIFFSFLCGNMFGQFQTRAASNLANAPYSVAVGDFNGDGRLDVAALSDGPSGVTILIGNGDGTFHTGRTYPVGKETLNIIAADFRHNGKLDLAITDALNNELYVMLGNGDGTFQAPVAYPTDGNTSVVATGDFTGDGKLDIIAVTSSSQCICISVLPGNGDGTFGAAATTPVPYDILPSALAVGHFNADNKLDVAVTGSLFANDRVDILLGNGDGTFRPNGYYNVLLDPRSVAVGDFNGDNKSDLAVGDFLGSDIIVLLGNGDGTFRHAGSYNTPFPFWTLAQDVDGDGQMDIVVSNFGASIGNPAGVSVLKGNGDGTFLPGTFFPAGLLSTFVAAGDFNGDGQTDFVLTNKGSTNSVITLLNTGTVSFSPTTPVNFPFQLVGAHSAPQTVTLSNTGTSALTISSVGVTGDFAASSTCGSSVASGASCTINVTFSPTSQGIKSGLVLISDSASSKPQVIELAGMGTVVELSAQSLNFGSQKVGSKGAPQTVQLTNTGAGALTINKIIDNGINGIDFPQTNNCPSSLGAGASCTITVTFQPQKTGTRTGQISITDSGGGSPQVVPVSGTGD